MNTLMVLKYYIAFRIQKILYIILFTQHFKFFISTVKDVVRFSMYAQLFNKTEWNDLTLRNDWFSLETYKRRQIFFLLVYFITVCFLECIALQK